MADQATADARHDDRLLPFVRFVAIAVLPFLLVAFGLLYVRSDLAESVFAWPIRPRMTAMLLGAAYFGGAVFFSIVLGVRRWRVVRLGMPPILLFVVVLIATTAIHWSSFSFDRPAGPVWVVVYLAAAPLLAIAILRNRTRDPGPGEGEPLLGSAIGAAWAVGGSFVVGLAAILFLAPDLVGPAWPWKITALGGRVIAATLVEPGALALAIGIDRRLSSIRAPLVAQATALVAIIVATYVRRDDLVGPAPAVLVWWTGLLFAFVATLWLLRLALAADRAQLPSAAT